MTKGFEQETQFTEQKLRQELQTQKTTRNYKNRQVILKILTVFTIEILIENRRNGCTKGTPFAF